MVWKQWKRGTTRYRELPQAWHRRGRRPRAPRAAPMVGGTSRIPAALKITLSNAYFASLGFPELTAPG